LLLPCADRTARLLLLLMLPVPLPNLLVLGVGAVPAVKRLQLLPKSF
jgi:hypothetical protein